MKLVRTFHPVGHGAFYTERFYEDNNPHPIFTAVYDCGSITKGTALRSAIDSEFSTYKDIDVVFISHFHEDHINGLDYLKRKCSIKYIVIPLMPKSFIVYTMIYNVLRWGANNQANNLITSFNTQNADVPFNVIKVDDIDNLPEYLMPESIRGIWSYRSLVLRSFSNKFNNRLQQLVQTLQQDVVFNVIFSKGIIKYTQLNQLLQSNSNIQHLRALLANNKLDGNQYNMIVGSEPTNSYNANGCLYTGDAMLACAKRMNLVQQYFFLKTLYHCVQVPHHGVKGDNHNINLYRAIKTCLISVKDNDPKHPTTKVKADIINQGGNYLIVTDKSRKVIFNYSV